jgi:hypothetical protein
MTSLAGIFAAPSPCVLSCQVRLRAFAFSIARFQQTINLAFDFLRPAAWAVRLRPGSSGPIMVPTSPTASGGP